MMVMDDPPLTLSAVHSQRLVGGSWRDEVHDWAIVQPMAKLRAKYTHGTSLIFSHYVFGYPHREPDRITPVDLSAVDRLMGANISASNDRWKLAHSKGLLDKVQGALARIPRAARIADVQHDAALLEAIEAFSVEKGLKLAIATKLLCIKRPFLVPMMDSVVQNCLGSTTEPAVILRGFRRLLADAAVAGRIETLRAQVGQEFALDISPVRILDELIWFDWNVVPEDGPAGRHFVRGFPEWTYDPAQDELGVHRRGQEAGTEIRSGGAGEAGSAPKAR